MVQVLTGKDVDRTNPAILVSVFPSNKGLNNTRVATNIPPENSIEDTNNFIGFSNTRRTRPGIEEFSNQILSPSDEFGIQFLMEHWRLNTSTNAKDLKNLVVTKDVIWADNGSGSFTVVGNTTDTTLNKAITGDVLVGLGIIGVEDSGLYTYDHSTLIHLISEPNVWIVKKHRNSIYATGDKSAPDVLYKSDSESTAFTGGVSDVFNLDTGSQSNSGNTAIFEYYGRLYVGKETSIYEIQTDVSGSPTRLVSDTVGVIAHNGVQVIGGDVIFPSNRGLHSLKTTQNYGDVEQSFLSEPVSELWASSIDLSRAQLISSAYIPEYNSYLMLYPVKNSSSFNLLGYSIATGDFYLWPNYPATFISRQIDSASKSFKLAVGGSNGKIGRGRSLSDTTFLDFNTGYNTSFRTPPIFPGGLSAEEFQFKSLKLFIKPRTGIITIDYQIDNGATRTITIDQSQLASGNTLAIKTVPLVGIGSTIQFTFNCDSSGYENGTAIEILGYNIECVSVGDTFQVNNFNG